MDLKGPIVDTTVHIIPSNTLIKYIKEIPFNEDIPENVAKIIKGKCYVASKRECNINVNVRIELSSSEISSLKKIVADVKLNDNAEKIKGNNEVTGIANTETVNSINVSTEAEQTDEATNSANVGDENIVMVPYNTKKLKKISEESQFLKVDDVDWLYDHLQQLRQSGAKDIPYLHELLEGSQILTPENEVVKRNPELEARCVKLRAQQEARQYRAMTKGVDNVRIRFPEDSISYQLKQLNRQLIAVGQFLLSIFAGFLFGFKGVELMIGGFDFGFRLLLGVMCALIIALAEIYFLAKKLNEELSIPETTQLGGPSKFANYPDPQTQVKGKKVMKDHQD